MAVILLAFIQATVQNGTVQGGAAIQTPQSAPLTLSNIAVSPVTMTVSPDAVVDYSAMGTYSDNSRADVTTQCGWSSSNTTVAQIGVPASPQTVNAISVGTANIRCTIGTVVGSSPLTVSGIAITTTNIPLGTIGNPYSVTFTASGGTLPYTFSLTTGLSSLTGIGLGFAGPTLSGTPNAQGNYGFTVTVQDSSSPPLTATNNYVLQVSAVAPPVVGGYAKLPQTWVNTHECDPPGGVYDVVRTMYANGTGNYQCTMAQLNQATQDWANAPDQSWLLKISSTNDTAHGGQCRVIGSTGQSANANWALRTKVVGGQMPTKCFVVESTTPNPSGETVCAGVGNQGNPLLMSRNLGCVNGPWKANMWYLGTNSVYTYGTFIQMGGWDATNNIGVNHIVIRDAEMTPPPTAVYGAQDSVFIVDTAARPTTFGGRNQTLPLPTAQLGRMGAHIGFERNYIHGDYGDNGRSPQKQPLSNGVTLNPAYVWMAWNYVDQFAMPNTESHITGSIWSTGPQKLVGNYFEGASVQSFWGGTSGQVVAYVPSDIEIRRNYYTKPQTWMDPQVACGAQSMRPGLPLTGSAINQKNTSEMKSGERVIINGNIYEWSTACGQIGQTLTFNVRNTSGGAWGNNYLNHLWDVTVTNNIHRYAGNGIQMDGRSSSGGNGGGMTWPLRRLTVINNLFYDIGNTPRHSGGQNNTYVIDGGASNLTFFVNTVERQAGIAKLVLSSTGSGNPANGTGKLQIMMSPGEPVAVTGCGNGIVDPSFNTPNPSTQMGPLLVPPTDPLGLTIYYPNAGPDVSTTSAAGGGCNVLVRQGAPFYFTFSHNTLISYGGMGFPGNTVGMSPVPSFMMFSTYQDNLITNSNSGPAFRGLQIAGATEGDNSATRGWDKNTLTMDYNTWPFRASAARLYTAWTPTCAAANNCLPGTDPNSKLWFPAAIVCPGATVGPTDDCVGFHGMMNGVPYLLWNTTNPLLDYSLVPSSPYHAGNAREAHDHTDLGVSMPALGTAFSEHKYSGCSTVTTAQNYCGPTGPYPD